jgi:hypothetical protein
MVILPAAVLPTGAQDYYSGLDPRRPHAGDEISRTVIEPMLRQHGGTRLIEQKARSEFDKFIASQPPMPSEDGKFPLPLFQGNQTTIIFSDTDRCSARAVMTTADEPAAIAVFYKNKLQTSFWSDIKSMPVGEQRQGIVITAYKSRWQAEITIVASRRERMLTSITLTLQPHLKHQPGKQGS